jgi:hypothetical protein
MLTKIASLLTFAALAIWKGIPFHRWPAVWAIIVETHEAEMRQAVWELKQEGRVREDEQGRLYSTKEK